MWAMKPSDKHELDAYRALGTVAELQSLKANAHLLDGSMSPLPFADHVVEYDGEWCGITGVPGLLEED